MVSEIVRSYGQLIRPMNGAIVSAAIVTAALLAGAMQQHTLFVLLGAVAGAIIAGGGNAINDYFDVAIDRINKPDRPLVRGTISTERAWWTWRVLSSLGVLLSAYIGPYTFAIALFWVVTLYWYSRSLKRTALWGNLIVALATALALVYGGAIVGRIDPVLIPALFAFLINFARELVKGAEDVEGDARDGARTLAVRYGISTALGMATIVLVALIAATVFPFVEGLYTIWYLILIMPVDLLLLFIILTVWRTRTPQTLSRVSTLLKASMILGIAAIALGSYPWN